MTKSLLVVFFTVGLAVPAFGQADLFICGNENHDPRHAASTHDQAKALSRRYGCRGWHYRWPDTSQSMPIPNAAYMARMARQRAMDAGLEGLNEYADGASAGIAWHQMRPENLDQQPFTIIVSSTSLADRSKRFQVRVSSRRATPSLYGYVTLTSWVAVDTFDYRSSVRHFAKVEGQVQGETLLYEFAQPYEETSISPPDAGSQFSLSDVPLDGDDAAPKNIYWFYLKDFAR